MKRLKQIGDFAVTAVGVVIGAAIALVAIGATGALFMALVEWLTRPVFGDWLDKYLPVGPVRLIIGTAIGGLVWLCVSRISRAWNRRRRQTELQSVRAKIARHRLEGKPENALKDTDKRLLQRRDELQKQLAEVLQSVQAEIAERQLEGKPEMALEMGDKWLLQRRDELQEQLALSSSEQSISEPLDREVLLVRGVLLVILGLIALVVLLAILSRNQSPSGLTL